MLMINSHRIFSYCYIYYMRFGLLSNAGAQISFIASTRQPKISMPLHHTTSSARKVFLRSGKRAPLSDKPLLFAHGSFRIFSRADRDSSRIWRYGYGSATRSGDRSVQTQSFQTLEHLLRRRKERPKKREQDASDPTSAHRAAPMGRSSLPSCLHFFLLDPLYYQQEGS